MGSLPVLPLGLELEPPPARWTPLDRRARGTEFVEIPVRTVLNSPGTTGMGFWSLNPYVGCELGCTYCYARDTHRWLTERAGGSESTPDAPVRGELPIPPWLQFERRILVKTVAADVLARTLDPGKLGGRALVIGTATDPYQPAERRYRLTRRVLERLLAYRGLSISITTKSPLVARDIDVLRRLGERHEVSVNFSLISLDARLLRRLEPRSPAPRARLRALARLTAAGVHAGVFIAPILPGLTDDRRTLDAVMAAARSAGARYAIGMPLRLNPAARGRFLPFFEREFPELAERYRRHYGERANARRSYVEALARRIRALQRRHGFPVSGERRRAGRPPRREPAEPQASLWS
ncbi:MAG TPA: radical SAM protein [Gemmatimonadales bacterium]|nr:radical SAM protein [Gemmatimonadales bacterium]